MLIYDQGNWGVSFIWQLRGSVIPKALCWAIPSAALSVGLHFLMHGELFAGTSVDERVGDKLNTGQVWTGYNFLIAFLLTFRTGKAYSRWWEGGTLLRQARGEWFNAYSSLIAFSSHSKKPKEDVLHFQRGLATLMSHLFCASLNTIAQVEEPFDVLDLAPLSAEGVDFLLGQEDKVELIIVWIQRLVTTGLDNGILAVPPPVLSRVFQEISRGVVNLNEVRKISEYLFPFPYAQLTTCILLLHTVLSPIAAGMLLETWYWSCIFTLFSVFAFWSLNYVAAEIECPFGDDDNDLPMVRMSRYFNRTLLMLLCEEAQVIPLVRETVPGSVDTPQRASVVKDFIGAGRRDSKDDIKMGGLISEGPRLPSCRIDSDVDLSADHSISGGRESPRQAQSKNFKKEEPCPQLPNDIFINASAAALSMPQLQLPEEWEPGAWKTPASAHDAGDLADPPAKPCFAKSDDQLARCHLAAAAVLVDDARHDAAPPADPASTWRGTARAGRCPPPSDARRGAEKKPRAPISSDSPGDAPRARAEARQSDLRCA